MSDEFRTRFGGNCYPSILETNQADAEMETQGFHFYGNAVPEDGAGFVRVYKRKPPNLLSDTRKALELLDQDPVPASKRVLTARAILRRAIAHEEAKDD